MEWEIRGRSSKQNWLRGGLDPRARVCLFRRDCKKTSEKRWEAVMKIKVFVLRGTLAVFVVLGTMGAPQASAQAVYGSIFGTVTDPSGAAVAGAKVTVTSATKGTTFDTTTNSDGNYSVTHLIPDIYNIRAEGSGFKAFEAKNINVSADAGSRVDGHRGSYLGSPTTDDRPGRCRHHL